MLDDIKYVASNKQMIAKKIIEDIYKKWSQIYDS